MLLACVWSGIHARESGSNKQSASKSCALSLVRQMFHLGVIEAYTGAKKKKGAESVSQLPPQVACEWMRVCMCIVCICQMFHLGVIEAYRMCKSVAAPGGMCVAAAAPGGMCVDAGVYVCCVCVS